MLVKLLFAVFKLIFDKDICKYTFICELDMPNYYFLLLFNTKWKITRGLLASLLNLDCDKL